MNLTENKRSKTRIDSCKMIKTEKPQLFPYSDIALSMYIYCPTFNWSAERLFPAQKRVKFLFGVENEFDYYLNKLEFLFIEFALNIDMVFDDDIINCKTKST